MKILPFLLVGTLSMFFAEILSGASHIWFIDLWSLIVTYPLYLFHLLFFIYIANKYNRTSISQLYLLGILFGLYEAWITKVIWWGYEVEMSYVMGSFLGVGIGEYLILTLFWHPIISFIIPLLVYQIITKKTISSHNQILTKTKRKTVLLYITTILISTFIAFNFQFNLAIIYIAIFGSLLIIYLLSRSKICKESDISKLVINNGFKYVLVVMILLYLLGFFLLNPTHLPNNLMAYFIIIFSYIFIWFLFKKSKEDKLEIIDISESSYSVKDIKTFLYVLLISVTIFSTLLSPITIFIFSLTYFLMCFIGLYIFFRVSMKV